MDAVCGVVVRDNKLLIVRKQSKWTLPGRKIDEADRKVDKGAEGLYCLAREFAEGLNGTRIYYGLSEYYRDFEGVSSEHRVRAYRVELDGEVRGVSGEVGEFAWMKYLDMVSYGLSDTEHKTNHSL